MPKHQLLVILGGPSAERGVSLNSARSLLDHIPKQDWEVIPLYVDQKKRFYKLSTAQLYSNTPSDFDFKLQEMTAPLTERELQALLESVSLVFPVIHGSFGEDGDLQAFLEAHKVPFVGSSSEACRHIYAKHLAHSTMRKHGISVWPQQVLYPGFSQEEVKLFFVLHAFSKGVLKPSYGGSSLGVDLIDGWEMACDFLGKRFTRGESGPLVLEPFCWGKEFTVVVLEEENGIMVLPPTEIVLKEHGGILDFRAKYLPTDRVCYRTPATFDPEIHREIREKAELLFTLFHARDFLRLDGWVMPDGKVFFTDCNPLSGLEQNSFFFQQAAVVGWSHGEVLHKVLANSCRRHHIALPQPREQDRSPKMAVWVLFGSDNAERQVSLLSGTNVWLKLLASDKFFARPFFLDSQNRVWPLSYREALYHTVEEIEENCLASLAMIPDRPYTLEQFLDRIAEEKAFVFLALHGGIGESGVLQQMLEERHVPYNGSSSCVSSLCLDKYKTGEKIAALHNPLLQTLPKKNLHVKEWEEPTREACDRLFTELVASWMAQDGLLIKPRSDGCSAGVVRLLSGEDLHRYFSWMHSSSGRAAPYTFPHQSGFVEKPSVGTTDFILEPYILCDEVRIVAQQLHHCTHRGWVELTVGVLEKEKQYQSLVPSLSVAEGTVLTVEEKFQGGTGVNLTPPPQEILSKEQVQSVQRQVEIAAKALDLRNYARLDLFFHRFSGEVILIEVNTLPALTPSTVLYHQALAANPPLFPTHFLEKIVEHAWSRFQ